jgi:hypothetical protein
MNIQYAQSRGSIVTLKAKNDPEGRANRAARRSGAGDRVVELRKPLGITLNEDKEGNVFVVAIDPFGRAAQSRSVFVGDQVKMVSATFGEDMWTCENVGLARVVSCVNARNTKPVRFVLQAPDIQEERRRREIAFKETSVQEQRANEQVRVSARKLCPYCCLYFITVLPHCFEQNDRELLRQMEREDAGLLRKGKGLFGLW